LKQEKGVDVKAHLEELPTEARTVGSAKRIERAASAAAKTSETSGGSEAQQKKAAKAAAKTITKDIKTEKVEKERQRTVVEREAKKATGKGKSLPSLPKFVLEEAGRIERRARDFVDDTDDKLSRVWPYHEKLPPAIRRDLVRGLRAAVTNTAVSLTRWADKFEDVAACDVTAKTNKLTSKQRRLSA